MNERLHLKIRRSTVAQLHLEESDRRWPGFATAWPTLRAVVDAATRDQFLSCGRVNPVDVACTPGDESAGRSLAARAAAFPARADVHLRGADIR
jgi:hypothetical protein